MEARSQVFISYAREDESSAIRIYEELEKIGANPWLDKKSLLPGQHWRNEIINAIENCNHFIALLSSKSVSKRGFVQKELKTALDLLDEFPAETKKPWLILSRLDDCNPSHPKLKDIHWVDLFPKWEDGVKKIFQSLNYPNRIENDKSFKQTVEVMTESTGRYIIYLNSTWSIRSPYLRYLVRHNIHSLIHICVEEVYKTGTVTPITTIEAVFSPQELYAPNLWYWKDSETHEELHFNLQLNLRFRLSENEVGKLYKPEIYWYFEDYKDPIKRIPITGFHELAAFKI